MTIQQQGLLTNNLIKQLKKASGVPGQLAQILQKLETFFPTLKPPVME